MTANKDLTALTDYELKEIVADFLQTVHVKDLDPAKTMGAEAALDERDRRKT